MDIKTDEEIFNNEVEGVITTYAMGKGKKRQTIKWAVGKLKELIKKYQKSPSTLLLIIDKISENSTYKWLIKPDCQERLNEIKKEIQKL